jgi:uncharacterized membrane protein YcaP (DUF421 family)
LPAVDWSHWFGIVGRTTAVYVVILAALRLGGRREIAQLEPFDLVIVLLVANAVQNAMVGADVTLGGGVLSALTLFCLNWLLSYLTFRYPEVRRLVEGMGRVVVSDGKFVDKALRIEHLTRADITRIVQDRLDVETPISEVEKAVLEVDGTVSVVRMDHTIARSNAKLPSRRTRRRYRPVGN